MKAWIVAVASIVVGVGAGIALARMQYGASRNLVSDSLPAGQSVAAPAAQPSQAQGAPVVEVDERSFAFGKMEQKSKMSHAFKFSNRGTAPLKLTKGETTCKCTLSNLDADTVPPGGTAIVSLEWRAETGPGPFRQTATILTNDPMHPQVDLEVQGEIAQSVSLTPDLLVMSNIHGNKETTAEAGVYAFHRDAFAIRSYKALAAGTASFFEVTWTPATPEQLKEREATSGYVIKVTVKPGLPLGIIKQRISLETDLSDSPNLEIAIDGTVTSDISIVGQDWSSSLGLLKLGRLSKQEAAVRSLKLLIRGEHRENVEFKVAKIEPDVLKVKIGDRSEINKGTITAVPLEISVPKGSRAVNCLGSEMGKYGEILLDTNHPDVKQVRLQVLFAVEAN